MNRAVRECNSRDTTPNDGWNSFIGLAPLPSDYNNGNREFCVYCVQAVRNEATDPRTSTPDLVALPEADLQPGPVVEGRPGETGTDNSSGRTGGSSPTTWCRGIGSPRGCDNNLAGTGSRDTSPGDAPATTDGATALVNNEWCRAIGAPAGCNANDAQAFVRDVCGQTVSGPGNVNGQSCSLSAKCQELRVPNDQCTAANAIAARNNGGTGGDSPSQESEQQVAVRQCQEAFTKAQQCCDDPISCVTNGAMSKNDSQGLEMMAQAVMGQLGGQGNIENICRSQETLAYTSAAINAMSARSCESKRNYCQQTCATHIRNAEGMVFTNSTARRTAETATNRLRNWKEECDGFANSTAASTAEVASSVNQVMQARLCRENAAGQASAFNLENPLNPNCADPANASNPFCNTNFCAQPGMENNPICGGSNLAGGGSPSGPSLGDGGLGSSLDGGAYLPGADVAAQDAQYGEASADAATNAGIAMNGGGFSPGGGASGGGGGGGARGGGGAGSQGKNTDIMQGFRGGGGYTTSGVATQSRGGGGGGSGGRAAGGFAGMNIMDLKKLLPGFEKSPSRSIAGMGAARVSSDLGLAHEDIFTKMTRAVTRSCLSVRLTDCSPNAGKGN